METYDFETTDFALSDNGVHLLRSRYNYKTIPYSEITKAIIKRAVEINNGVIALILGILLTVFAIKQSIHVIQLFNDPNVHRVYIEAIVLPILPGFVGIYLIWNATRKGPLLIIETNKGKHKLRLRQVIKSKKTDLLDYLREKLSYKLIEESAI